MHSGGGRKATFYSILRDRWKNLRDRFSPINTLKTLITSTGKGQISFFFSVVDSVSVRISLSSLFFRTGDMTYIAKPYDRARHQWGGIAPPPFAVGEPLLGIVDFFLLFVGCGSTFSAWSIQQPKLSHALACEANTIIVESQQWPTQANHIAIYLHKKTNFRALLQS